MTVRERNLLPGDPRDTFVDQINSAAGIWEMAVPNGRYVVSLICGDTFTSATHRVALEGQVVVNDVYTTGGNFVQRTNLPVTVADGRLTLTVGGSGQITHTKVNCIEVLGLSGSQHPRGDIRVSGSGGAWVDVGEMPIRSRTSLTVLLPHAGRVRLAVHDVRGRRVAIVHDGWLPAGRRTFEWAPADPRGARLASGVYFLHLESPDGDLRRKLLVLR